MNEEYCESCVGHPNNGGDCKAYKINKLICCDYKSFLDVLIMEKIGKIQIAPVSTNTRNANTRIADIQIKKDQRMTLDTYIMNNPNFKVKIEPKTVQGIFSMKIFKMNKEMDLLDYAHRNRFCELEYGDKIEFYFLSDQAIDSKKSKIHIPAKIETVKNK